jgi:hypothetical protein
MSQQCRWARRGNGEGQVGEVGVAERDLEAGRSVGGLGVGVASPLGARRARADVGGLLVRVRRCGPIGCGAAVGRGGRGTRGWRCAKSGVPARVCRRSSVAGLFGSGCKPSPGHDRSGMLVGRGRCGRGWMAMRCPGSAVCCGDVGRRADGIPGGGPGRFVPRPGIGPRPSRERPGAVVKGGNAEVAERAVLQKETERVGRRAEALMRSRGAGTPDSRCSLGVPPRGCLRCECGAAG